jgi:hypothetical protein
MVALLVLDATRNKALKLVEIQSERPEKSKLNVAIERGRWFFMRRVFRISLHNSTNDQNGQAKERL